MYTDRDIYAFLFIFSFIGFNAARCIFLFDYSLEDFQFPPLSWRELTTSKCSHVSFSTSFPQNYLGLAQF